MRQSKDSIFPGASWRRNVLTLAMEAWNAVVEFRFLNHSITQEQGLETSSVTHRTNEMWALHLFQMWVGWAGKAWALWPLEQNSWNSPKEQLEAQASEVRHFPQSFRSHAFADDSKTSAHLSKQSLQEEAFSFLMDASNIFHYQEQISIDAKGSCFQECLLNLLDWLKVIARPPHAPLLRLLRKLPVSCQVLGKGRNISDWVARSKNSK